MMQLCRASNPQIVGPPRITNNTEQQPSLPTPPPPPDPGGNLFCFTSFVLAASLKTANLDTALAGCQSSRSPPRSLLHIPI